MLLQIHFDLLHLNYLLAPFAEFILRVILGVLFFFQGYDKIFNLKISGVVETFQMDFENKKIPRFFLLFAAYFSSYTEILSGLLLILGFLRFYALCALGLDLLLVSVAFSVLQPMWDMRHVFPRLLFLIALLVMPSQWFMFGLDKLFS